MDLSNFRVPPRAGDTLCEWRENRRARFIVFDVDETKSRGAREKFLGTIISGTDPRVRTGKPTVVN